MRIKTITSAVFALIVIAGCSVDMARPVETIASTVSSASPERPCTTDLLPPPIEPARGVGPNALARHAASTKAELKIAPPSTAFSVAPPSATLLARQTDFLAADERLRAKFGSDVVAYQAERKRLKREMLGDK